MSDPFSTFSPGLTSPITRGLGPITPHDSNDLPAVTREIYAAGAGNIAVVWADGSETVEPIGAGERVAWRVRRVRATGTTATGIRGYI